VSQPIRTGSDAAAPQPPSAPSEHSLARALARRCRGRTLVLGRAPAALLDRLAHEQIDAEVRPAAAAHVARNESFDAVLVVDVLEHLEAGPALDLLQDAYALVAPHGQLLVCVPHGELLPGSTPRQTFSRSSLKQLLERIDQPKVYTDQPYSWLFMGVERDPVLDHAAADRCRAIAALCRGRVLELGCGPGHLCAEIARHGLEVVGVDLSARKVARARARHPGIDFRQQDILALPADAAHDTVVLAEVLEHVPVDVGGAMLAHAWSMVAPGGQLVVSVPNEDCVPHRNHLREFTADGLRELLARFGEPRIAATQPFKWLLVNVDKPAGGRTGAPAADPTAAPRG
jgi:2-polyprenyl-3-methyl-5-hydroxy-6-metoxy-1,4-benzoquinol methylase